MQLEVQKRKSWIKISQYALGLIGFLAFAYLFFGTIDSNIGKSRCRDTGEFWLARPFGNRMAVGGWDYEAREGMYKDLQKKKYLWGYCIQKQVQNN